MFKGKSMFLRLMKADHVDVADQLFKIWMIFVAFDLLRLQPMTCTLNPH